MSDMVHVCYFLYDKSGHFSKFLGTSLNSLLQNASCPLTVHLLCYGSVDEVKQERFRFLAQKYGQSLCIYDASSFRSRVVDMLHSEWLKIFSPACIYRLFMWELLPEKISRVIWLDADTIIHLDIAELWSESVGVNGLAGVVDTIVKHLPGKETILEREAAFDTKRYFNAGVLLMERQTFSRSSWEEEVIAFFQKFPQAWYGDQDVLNYYYGESYHILPEKYNTLVGWCNTYGIKQIERRIYHYSGDLPDFDFSNSYTRLFFSYFAGTPWCDVTFLSRLWSVVDSACDVKIRMLRRHYRSLSGKKLLLVGTPTDEKKMRQIFSIPPSEPYTIFVPGIKKQNIDIDSLYDMSKESIVLLLNGSYEDMREEFLAKGYKDGIDFINGDELLTMDEGGIPIDGHGVLMQL